MASLPFYVLLYNGSLLCGSNVPIKWLIFVFWIHFLTRTSCVFYVFEYFLLLEFVVITSAERLDYRDLLCVECVRS